MPVLRFVLIANDISMFRVTLNIANELFNSLLYIVSKSYSSSVLHDHMSFVSIVNNLCFKISLASVFMIIAGFLN